MSSLHEDIQLLRHLLQEWPWSKPPLNASQQKEVERLKKAAEQMKKKHNAAQDLQSKAYWQYKLKQNQEAQKAVHKPPKK